MMNALCFNLKTMLLQSYSLVTVDNTQSSLLLEYALLKQSKIGY